MRRFIMPISVTLMACALHGADGVVVPVANGGFESGAKDWENGAQLSSE